MANRYGATECGKRAKEITVGEMFRRCNSGNGGWIAVYPQWAVSNSKRVRYKFLGDTIKIPGRRNNKFRPPGQIFDGLRVGQNFRKTRSDSRVIVREQTGRSETNVLFPVCQTSVRHSATASASDAGWRPTDGTGRMSAYDVPLPADLPRASICI